MEQPIENLTDLERRLAHICTHELRELRSAEVLDNQKHTVVEEALSLLAHTKPWHSEIKPRTAGLLVESTRRFLSRLTEQSRVEASQLLADQVAELVARYDASAAYLFCTAYSEGDAPPEDHSKAWSPNKPISLYPVASHNNTPPTTLAADPQKQLQDSMAAACVVQRHFIVYDNIIVIQGKANVPSYHHTKLSSRSAVAVPLKCPSDERIIIGVLVLESTAPYAFTVANALELDADATILIDGVASLHRQISHPPADFVWFPRPWNWNLTPVLNELCQAISCSASDSSVAACGVTIWKSDHSKDWEEDSSAPKRLVMRHSAFALGAAGFDSDYLTKCILPTVKLVCENGEIRAVTSLILIGAVLLKGPHNLVPVQWNTSEFFVRRAKARRMELDSIYMDTIPSGIVSPVPVCPPGAVPLANSIRDELITFYGRQGALAIYTYRGTPDKVKPHLAAQYLSRCGRTIGAFLDSAHAAIRESALAFLVGQLHTTAITGVNTLNIVRDTLMDVLDLDGCSLFWCHKGDDRKPNTLECVSTSGVNAFGKEEERGQVVYDLVLDSPSNTVKLFMGNETQKRINRYLQHESNLFVRFRESFTMSEYQHRRTLFQVVKHGEDRVGIIRAVRSSKKQPFTAEDGIVLQVIADHSARAFVFKEVTGKTSMER